MRSALDSRENVDTIREHGDNSSIMGQRGPLPKPTKRKKLEGNPGRRPLPDDEPEPRLLSEIPAPPDWFDDEVAIAAYWVVCRELHDAEILAALDIPIVEMYCTSYAQWRKMLGEIKKHGFTHRATDEKGRTRYAAVTSEATLCRQYAADCNRYAKVLGLGPAYRVGLKIGSDPKEQSDPIADELDENKLRRLITIHRRQERRHPKRNARPRSRPKIERRNQGLSNAQTRLQSHIGPA